MKLTYHVLCIDDKIITLEDKKDKISAFNDAVGIETLYTDIEVKIGPRDDPEQFWYSIIGKLEQSFAENTYDMILVDLHMGNVSGADIIASIRNTHTIYRPIIFYSAGEPSSTDKAIQQLNEAAGGASILGKSVIITSRERLSVQAISIFDEMHREEHKINSVRGLLMDSVSEFDASILEFVENDRLWKLVPDGASKNKIVTEFRKNLQQDSDEADALLKSIKKLDVNAIQNYLKTNPKNVSTYRKGYLLKSILKQIKNAETITAILSAGIDTVGDSKSLREIRNEYGHSTAENLKATHTNEKCVHIRKEARRQINNIAEIHKLLGGD